MTRKIPQIPSAFRGARLPAMLSRMFVVVTMSTIAFGCADMLGLGGLTYDQGEGELIAATGGTEAGSGGGPSGGGGQPKVSGDGDGDLVEFGGALSVGNPDGFSISLDRQALIATSPRPGSLADYFFFDPSREQLSFRRQDGWNSVEVGVFDFPAPDGLTQLAVVPHQGGMTVIGYHLGRGYSVHATVSDAGAFDLVSIGDGTGGRSALLAFFGGDTWWALSYSSSDGNYRYFNPDPDEAPALFASSWEPGWTSLAPFSVGPDTGVLKFDSASGRLQFDRFAGQGEPFENVLEIDLPGTFTLMETFGGVSGGQREGILLYESGSGEVVTGKIVEQGGEFLFVELGGGYFRGDLSQIVALGSTQQESVLTFSSATGQAVLRDVSSTGDFWVPIVR